MNKKIVNNKTIHSFVLLLLCIIGIFSFCACGNMQSKKTTIYVFADSSMESDLPLVGEKFLVTEGKDFTLKYVFDKPEALENRITSGETCDLLITASESVIQDLLAEGMLFKEESIPIVRSRMALIVPDDEASFPNLDEILVHSEVGPEEYQPYTDLLWEIYGDEGWQEEWGENDGDIWIRSDFTGIAICSSRTKEGALGRLILNRNDQGELLDRAHLILEYDSAAELIAAVSEHVVPAGICSVTDVEPEQGVRIQVVFDHLEDPAEIFQACRIISSENTEAAKGLIEFLQGEHARRFFEDFGYECMR